jgi:hypothetical protein
MRRIPNIARKVSNSSFRSVGQPSVPISIPSNGREHEEAFEEDTFEEGENDSGNGTAVLAAVAVTAPLMFGEKEEEMEETESNMTCFPQRKWEITPEEVAHFAKYEILPSMRNQKYPAEKVEFFDRIVCGMASDPNIQGAFLKNPIFKELLAPLNTSPRLDSPQRESEQESRDLHTSETPYENWVEKKVEYCKKCASVLETETSPCKDDSDSGDVGSPPKPSPIQTSDLLKGLIPLVCVTVLGIFFYKYGKGLSSCFKGSDLRDCGRLLIMGAFDTLLRKKSLD